MFVVSTKVMTSSFLVVYPEINWIKKHWTSNTSKLTLPIWVDDGLESIITKTTQTSLSLLRWWGKGRLGRGHTLGRYAGNVLTDKKLREMICQFEEGIAGSLGGPGHYCAQVFATSSLKLIRILTTRKRTGHFCYHFSLRTGQLCRDCQEALFSLTMQCEGKNPSDLFT